MKRHGGERGEITLIEVLIILAIVGILLSLIFGSGGFTVSDGDRVGTLTKLSTKGVLIKTWEGELILGGHGTVTTNVWEFSVGRYPDKALLAQLQTALAEQRTVRLTYHQYFLFRPWRGDTTYFITAMTEAKEGGR